MLQGIEGLLREGGLLLLGGILPDLDKDEYLRGNTEEGLEGQVVIEETEDIVGTSPILGMMRVKDNLRCL